MRLDERWLEGNLRAVLHASLKSHRVATSHHLIAPCNHRGWILTNPPCLASLWVLSVSTSLHLQKAGAQTLRPVTIRQILDASQPHPDAEFSLDGAELGQVRVAPKGKRNIGWKSPRLDEEIEMELGIVVLTRSPPSFLFLFGDDFRNS